MAFESRQQPRPAKSHFDVATAVLEDRWGPPYARIDESFGGFAGAHGGYLAAIALRAMQQAVGDERRAVRSLNLVLLGPVPSGDLEIAVQVDPGGRSLAVASARLLQEDVPVGVAQGVFALSRNSIIQRGLSMPVVPPPDQCEPLFRKPVDGSSAGMQIDHRPAGAALPLAGAEKAEILVWMRLIDDRAVDVPLAAFLADGAVPALYASLREPLPIPTVSMALHFAPSETWPGSEWALGHFRSMFTEDGYTVEDGELWGPDGALLLQARQLRRILQAPPSTPVDIRRDERKPGKRAPKRRS